MVFVFFNPFDDSVLDVDYLIRLIGYTAFVGHYYDGHAFLWLSSYLVWVSVKLGNAKEEKPLVNDTPKIGSEKFDFSIE